MPYQVACTEAVMHGLYLLWWVQERQLPAASVAAVLAAGDLAIALLEVPTGWLADRFGHRASLMLGSLVQVVGMLCCWLAHGMPALVAASLLVALGDAFRSGADQALLFRTCAAIGREADFQRIEARTRAAQTAAMVGLVLVGGAIVRTWGFAAGWIAETLLCGIGLLIACAMVEPPPCSRECDPDDRPDEPRGRLAFGIGLPLGLMLPVAFLGAAESVASFLAQTTAHADPVTNTLLVAFVGVAEAVGSAMATCMPATGRRTQTVLLALGLLATGAAVAIPASFLAAVVVLAFLSGVGHPLRAAAIQRAVVDRARARAASIASACDMAVSLIALPIAGAWRSGRNTRRR